MMLTPEIFFKRYGVRTPGQILQPRLIPIDKLTLPRNSLLHYLPESEVELGPSPSNALLKNVTRLVLSDMRPNLRAPRATPVGSLCHSRPRSPSTATCTAACAC